MKEQSPPRRHPGRPRLDETTEAPSVYLRITVTAKQYDATYAAARRARLTMPDWIRKTLQDATTDR